MPRPRSFPLPALAGLLGTVNPPGSPAWSRSPGGGRRAPCGSPPGPRGGHQTGQLPDVLSRGARNVVEPTPRVRRSGYRAGDEEVSTASRGSRRSLAGTGPASGGSPKGRVVDSGEIDRAWGAEVVEHVRFVLGAWKQRLPPAEVLRAMDIARSDARECAVCDPAEQLTPIEELEAIGEVAQRAVVRPALRESRCDRSRLVRVWVGRDDRGAVVARRSTPSSIPSSTDTKSRSPIATACAARVGSRSL